MDRSRVFPSQIKPRQNLIPEDRYARCRQANADFVKLAEPVGVQARRLASPNDTRASLITDRERGLDEFTSWDGERDRTRRMLMQEWTGGRYRQLSLEFENKKN